jgi:hypothetical protein
MKGEGWAENSDGIRMTLFPLVTHPLTFFLNGIAFLLERTLVDGYLFFLSASLPDFGGIYAAIWPDQTGQPAWRFHKIASHSVVSLRPTPGRGYQNANSWVVFRLSSLQQVVTISTDVCAQCASKWNKSLIKQSREPCNCSIRHEQCYQTVI